MHPTVSHFFTHIPQNELEFNATELPCLTPPLPWLSPLVGGYLLNQTDFVRLPVSANEQEDRLRALSMEKIGGLLDSINVLNSCPWKINTGVLDLLIEIFQRGGSRQLSVPVSVENAKISEPLPVEQVNDQLDDQGFLFDRPLAKCSRVYRSTNGSEGRRPQFLQENSKPKSTRCGATNCTVCPLLIT